MEDIEIRKEPNSNERFYICFINKKRTKEVI